METSTYFTHYENTILQNIDLEAYEIEQENLSKFQLVNEVYKIFVSEYGYNIKRVGEKRAFADWLQGLTSVLTVPFYYWEIQEKAEQNGFEFMTEESKENFFAMYWINLSNAFFNLKENL